MDFAQKQLHKHGWKSGEGLGKESSGITEAIKVKIKNDNRGVGHDSGQEFTYHWWDHVFNKAASNIHITQSQDGVQIENSKATKVTKSKAKSYADKSMLYGQFVKGATLSDGRENNDNGHVTDSSEDDADKHIPCLVPDTEEEVFRQCGGRTAHKGARHGLKLNGKLARIEEQDRQKLLKANQTERLVEETRNSSIGEEDALPEVRSDNCPEGNETGDTLKKKKKKKKKKTKERVETVEEVIGEVEKLTENGARNKLIETECEEKSGAELNGSEDIVTEAVDKSGDKCNVEKRKSKKKKRKYEETEDVKNEDNDDKVVSDKSSSRKKKKKKSKS